MIYTLRFLQLLNHFDCEKRQAHVSQIYYKYLKLMMNILRCILKIIPIYYNIYLTLLSDNHTVLVANISIFNLKNCVVL